jgi:hypothetical protein
MQEEDHERQVVMARLREERDREISAKLDAHRQRVEQSIRNNHQMEAEKLDQIREKLENEGHREERLALRRHEQQEEGAKRSLQLLLKRQSIMTDAQRKLAVGFTPPPYPFPLFSRNDVRPSWTTRRISRGGSWSTS